jgi:hypothetical protein
MFRTTKYPDPVYRTIQFVVLLMILLIGIVFEGVPSVTSGAEPVSAWVPLPPSPSAFVVTKGKGSEKDRESRDREGPPQGKENEFPCEDPTRPSCRP